jgi:predicted O-methyltransferase YrrM
VRLNVKVNAPKANLVGLHTRYVNPGELDVICHLVRQANARSFLEIGTNTGRTSLAVLRNAPSVQTAWGIDVPPGYVFTNKVQAKEVPPQPGIVGLQDRRYRCLTLRYGTLDLMPDEMPKFDAIFVDGDHSEKAVRNDYAKAKQMLRDGKGVIIFHDDHGKDTVDVSRTLDAIWRETGANIVHVEGTWLAFEEVK